MIAAWLFELLRRERDWRAALANIATQLSELPEERIRAALDLGAAFEHIEPNRRRAIGAYQLAGAGRDGGRSRALAAEMGWTSAVARLAHVEWIATRALEPLIATCRALLDQGKAEQARRLFAEAAVADVRGDASVATLRAELVGKGGDWPRWLQYARTLSGSAAADVLVWTARLARLVGRPDWTSHLEAALVAEPGHPLAGAMLADVAFASGDRKAILDALKSRLAGADGTTYCEVLRSLVTRVMRETSNHGGLARRLLRGALDRAYETGLTEIRGHLAMWTLLDEAATQDRRRTQLLPLVLRGLDAKLPVFDRVWLAALGASICVEAGDTNAARAYAAVVAEHAPSHPIVLSLLAAATPARHDPELQHDLDLLELDAATIPPVTNVVPSDGFELARLSGRPVAARVDAVSVDPRYVDVSVPVLEDPEPAPEPPAPAPPPPTTVTTSVDEQWEVDDALFAPRRRPTLPPVSSIPRRPETTPTPPALAPNVAKLIPNAALQVLKAAGAPRPLPKIPSPSQAIPRATRTEMPVDIRLSRGGQVIDAHTRDLSITGFFAVTTAKLEIGSELDCEVRLPGADNLSERSIATRAKVARRDLGGYGLVLVDPPRELTAEIAAFGERR